MEDLLSLFQDFKDTNILLDVHSKYYLDFGKLRKLAKKYTITFEIASQCVIEMVERKPTDNMYTKFFILRGKNEKEAIEWIYHSVEERVKLSAA